MFRTNNNSGPVYTVTAETVKDSRKAALVTGLLALGIITTAGVLGALAAFHIGPIHSLIQSRKFEELGLIAAPTSLVLVALIGLTVANLSVKEGDTIS